MGDYQRPFSVTAHVEVVILADLENVGLKLQQDYGLSLKVKKRKYILTFVFHECIREDKL
jgi:hypothetical protein